MSLPSNEVLKYINRYEGDMFVKLLQLRKLVLSTAKNAEERMSYGMPSYHLNGPLIYFAANKKHLGIYPTPSPIKFFKEELAQYATSKGAIQIPWTEKLPISLIKKIIKFKIKENKQKNNIKK